MLVSPPVPREATLRGGRAHPFPSRIPSNSPQPKVIVLSQEARKGIGGFVGILTEAATILPGDL